MHWRWQLCQLSEHTSKFFWLLPINNVAEAAQLRENVKTKY